MVHARLREGKTAAFLDRTQTARAVAAAAREHDAHGVLALVFGERFEKAVDRPPILPGRCGLAQLQQALVDGERGVGRDDVDVPAQHGRAIGGFMHRYLRVALQQFGQEAQVVGRKMLHEHIGDVAAGLHVFEEGAEGFQPTGRCAKTHDQRKVGFLRLVGRSRHRGVGPRRMTQYPPLAHGGANRRAEPKACGARKTFPR